MVRDDLYITVPSFFRCPISLDVMKSPVSLCTGVTYDRSSIQRWLDTGNNTCPATMQVLHNKDLVPNHTLHRLIQIWSDSVRSRQPPPPPPPSDSIAPDDALLLVHKFDKILRSSNSLESVSDVLSKLAFFVKESDENRDFLCSSTVGRDLLRSLFAVLGRNCTDLHLLLQVVQLCEIVLKQFQRNGEAIALFPDSDMANEIGASLITGMQEGRLELRIAITRLLEVLISKDIEAWRSSVFEKVEIYYIELLSLVAVSKCEAMEVSLSCLVSLSTPRRNRAKLAAAGAVAVLGKTLAEAETTAASAERILKLLEMLSACKEGRAEMCEDRVCIQAIVRKMMKVSSAATEHAVTILWCLCCLFGDRKAQEAVGRSNGMAKVLLLLQSDCTAAVRQMARDLLKVLGANATKDSLLSSYDTKTTHIMPF